MINIGQIYSTHKRFSIRMLDGTQEECKELAHISAARGHDTLYRFFRDGRFVTAYSSFNGVVTEHADVTIPLAHW